MKGSNNINIDKIVKALSCTQLFNTFNMSEINSWITNNKCKVREYSKKHILHLQNEKCLYLDIIIKGKLNIQKIAKDGSVFTVATFSSCNTIGGNLLFSKNNSYPMTITCVEPCTIVHISKELVLKLCQTNERFLETFLSSLSDKTLIITNRLNSLTMKTIRQRIVEFLIYEYNIQQNEKILLETSKKELAERLGIQRPSLSRELNKMRKDGLIDFDSKTITIKDLNFLKSNIIDNNI